MPETTKLELENGDVLTIEELAHRGEDFEIAVAQRTADDVSEKIAVRSLRVDDGWPDKVKNRLSEHRRTEEQAASLLLGDNVALERVNPHGARDDSVLLHPYVEGMTLERHIHANFPEGAPLEDGLALMRQLAEQLSLLHEERIVHRAASPDHCIVNDKGELTLIGFGNACERQTRPAPWQLGGDERYVAPEVIRERSGTFIHPRADVYSFGATLSYVFSGIPPTDTPEAPIANDAWRRLMEFPEGLRLLIAHCMQPFHKNRLVNASKLLPYLQANSLPDRKTDGFGAIALLAPWTGALEGESSGLSPGPLTTRQQAGAEPDRDDESTEESNNKRAEPESSAQARPAELEEPAQTATDDADGSESTQQPVRVQPAGINKWRLFLGFGLIAAVILGGAFMRLCS
jgi:serine/threonine protein kinase